MTDGFAPSEALVTRAHDAAWERLAIGQHVTITPAGHPGAEMKITGIIPHADGGETYALEDVTVTDEQVAERKRAEAAMFASIAGCATCWPLLPVPSSGQRTEVP
jgi:hypothetical protein